MPPHCSDPPQITDMACQVLDHHTVGSSLRVLSLQPITETGAPASPVFRCHPGQFVMMDLPETAFFLRRPMSVLATHQDGSFDIYYRIVGRGTAMMATLKPGDRINVLGSLGNTFSPPEDPAHALLIGGGIGIAPLFLLGKSLQAAGLALPFCVYGVRSQDDIGLLEPLLDLFGADRLLISTDDGSYGFPGNVCGLLNTRMDLIQACREAYVCGPTVMMKSAAALLKTVNPAIRVEASLEEIMPCGTGACTGCVIFRTDQLLPSKICVEGPVFETDCLVWPGDVPMAQEVSACSR